MSCHDDLLLKRWRRQIGCRRPHRRRRPLAAVGFRLYGPSADKQELIDLRRVKLVLLFDEPIGRSAPALRLVGYRGSQTAHGVQWGGAGNARFYKDLRLPPAPGGAGLQVDATNADFLKLALQLQADLYRADRFHPGSARSEPVLPRPWAGFAPADAERVQGEGPELAALCDKFDLDRASILQKFRRERRGLVCFPLDWVSGQLHRSLAVFADMSQTPRRQVFRLPSIPDGLRGLCGASAFDFYGSPQRDHYERRLRESRPHMERRSASAAEPLAVTA